MAKKSKFKEFLKSIFSGLIGIGVFLMLSVFAFAIAKLVFILMKKDLLLSKYNIITTIVLFMFFGFAYGISCYVRNNSYRKLLRLNWITFLLDIILAGIFTFGGILVFKYRYNVLLGINGLIALFVLLFVMFYLFSAIAGNYLRDKKSRIKTHKIRNAIFFVLFNPFFIILYLWLFSLIAYNSVYIPCGVTIVGIDKNPNTVNTIGLDIAANERIINIDGVKIASLDDVKRFMNSLTSTREVIVETEKNMYYVKTYEIDGKRYMGFILNQEYCVKDYK
jgi:hypothetical protein